MELGGVYVSASGRARLGRPQLARPTVRTTYQLAATLSPNEGQSLDEVWTEAIKTTCGWLRDRSPDQLPQEAWEGRDFECGVPGHRIECATVADEGLWALRLTHPDMPHADEDAVPGRTWTTDVALKREEAGLRFGVRVYCTSQPYCDADVALTRPKIVRYMASNFVLSTVRPLEGVPWYLNTEEDLEAFHSLITDPARALPVYLLTQADARRMHVQVARYVLDEQDLARKALGLAHVAVLPRTTSFAWTDRVGKVWSAFLGAVRTYRPGLDFETDSPGEHPLAVADNIVFWRYNGLKGEKAFAEFLLDQAYKDSATRQVSWGGCLFFTDVRRRKAELARARASEQADWRELYEHEITALKKKIEEVEGERDESFELAVQAEKERDTYIAENNSLRWQIDSLRARLAEKTQEDPDAEIEIPDKYEDMPEWANHHLVGRLVLHPRALGGIRKAAYEDIELVYRALLLLANEYRTMRLGADGAKEAFEKKAGELGLRVGLSITRERAGEEGDTYFVRWPQHTCRKCFLEFHLRKGSKRDDRYCLGVYFFWDEDTRQVVVGWLPSHLDTRAT